MVRKLSKLAYIFSFAIFPVFVMAVASQRLANIPLRLAFFSFLVLGGAWLFRNSWPQQGWGTVLLVTSLGYGVVFKLANFIPDVTTYPFSLSWSEASRYYYASLWFSRLVYDTPLPRSVLHPSRYLMQSLPFLFPGATLVVHRLWQVLLWLAAASLTGWLLARRLAPQAQGRSQITLVSIILWAFLFLFQGPIYYHLLVIVILMLWGFDSQRFWRNLLVVIVASLWAGISRVNWLPVPGLMAAAIFLMDIPAKGKPIWQYLLPPAVWVAAGTAVAYASQKAYELLSGNPAAVFGSSFSSDLLWYRLLPNLTFPLGILPSAVLVSLPLVGLMVLHLQGRWRFYHPMRLLGLAGILLVLFAGGVVVSVKIGGGSNLHNLDAYLALLLIIGSYIHFNCFEPDLQGVQTPGMEAAGSEEVMKRFKLLETLLIAGAVALPLYFTLSAGGQMPRRDFPAAQSALQTIASTVRDAVAQGGEVLFINQRHLLTFDDIQDVPLVADNELVFLMEMAMADNITYLGAFHSDLSHQRFSLIVAEPLAIQYQGRSHGFGEENDAWVERVSEPVLCFYEPATRLDSVGVVLYTPRADPCR
jgi:hypothetical protein